MDVIILELPYIFSTMPTRIPLWKEILVMMLYDSYKIYNPKCVTNIISVQHVAAAVVCATVKGNHGKKYTFGDVNMDWIQMLSIMLKSITKKQTEGKQSGLDLRYLFKNIQCKTCYFDPTESINTLGYGTGGIKEAIDETIKKCVEALKTERKH